MANIPCPACAKPISPGSHFCPSCGAAVGSTASTATPADSPQDRPPVSVATSPSMSSVPGPRRASGCWKPFFIVAGLIFVVGVAGQLGWDWWKGQQKKASTDDFYALARPLLGTWKVVEDSGKERYTYTTRFLPNQSAFLPGEAPETLFFDCVENRWAAAWTFSAAVGGHLVGGGVDQTPPPPDFYTAHGTAEPSADGKRLTLHMLWDGTRDVVTVLERIGTSSAQPP